MTVKGSSLLLLLLAAATTASKSRFTITAPAHVAHPTDDYYQCVASKAPSETSHIVHFQPEKANYVHGRVHHMILFGCETPFQKSGPWECDSQPICGDDKDSFLLYAWAKKAPAMTMPKGAGFVVGGNTKLKYFVLQQHFLKKKLEGLPKPTGLSFVLQQGLPQKFAGMYILMVEEFKVPGGKKRVAVKTHCKTKTSEPITLFAYRTHAHDIGYMVHGTLNGKQIVKHSPQIPQSFNMLDKQIKVKPGDDMSVKCVYDSSKRHRVTKVGSTHLDEMCNLYFMFLSDKPALATYNCGGDDGEKGNFDSEQEMIQANKDTDNYLEDDADEDEEDTDEFDTEEAQ